MHFDPRAMKTGNGSDQAEPETVSRCVATVLESVKPLENMLIFIGGNSGPVIGDRENRRAANVFVRNHDLASGTAMLDRIVHEIGDRIKDQITIADHQHLTITDDGETSAVLFGRGVVQLNNLTRDI